MIERIYWWIKDLISNKPLGGLRSPLWNQTKREFEKLYPKVCAACGTTKKIELHHIAVFHLHPELENSLDNLIWLCRIHHFWVGHLGSFYSWNSSVKEDSAICLAKIKTRPFPKSDTLM